MIVHPDVWRSGPGGTLRNDVGDLQLMLRLGDRLVEFSVRSADGQLLGWGNEPDIRGAMWASVAMAKHMLAHHHAIRRTVDCC